MKFAEYLFFAALLTPTAAVVVAAAISVSIAGPETDVAASQTFQSEVVADYLLNGELEEQP